MTSTPKLLLGATMRPYAMCHSEVCDWEHPESGSTHDQAKAHVKETGHSVLVVTEKRDVYGVWS